MDTTAQDILDEARLELPGCPLPLSAAAMRDTVAEFLDRSQVLKVDLDAIDIVAATYLYDLALPTGYDGFKVGRPTLVVLNGLQQRACIDYRMKDADTLQLRDTPQSAITDGLQVTVSLALDDIQEASLEDLRQWWPAIRAGLKSRLMLMPAKPWSERNAAAIYRAEYNDGLGKAITYAATDGLNAPQRLGM